jgi:hypothetical protein
VGDGRVMGRGALLALGSEGREGLGWAVFPRLGRWKFGLGRCMAAGGRWAEGAGRVAGAGPAAGRPEAGIWGRDIWGCDIWGRDICTWGRWAGIPCGRPPGAGRAIAGLLPPAAAIDGRV